MDNRKAKVAEEKKAVAAEEKKSVVAEEKKAEPKKEKLPEFYVAPGKSITTKTRGIVGTEKSAKNMSEITLKDLAGNEEAFKILLEKGFIKKG